jgi:hypothetical protein
MIDKVLAATATKALPDHVCLGLNEAVPGQQITFTNRL